MTDRTPIPKASSNPDLEVTFDINCKNLIPRTNYFIDYETKKQSISKWADELQKEIYSISSFSFGGIS